jgi:bacillolysin
MKSLISKILTIILLFNFSMFSQKNEKLKENVAFQKTIKFQDEVDNNTAINLFSKQFNLGKGYSFEKKQPSEDKNGLVHTRQQQYYKGIKIEFGMLITHSLNNIVQTINGELYNADGLDLNPSLSKYEALNIAISSTKATKFLWESPNDAVAIDYQKPEGELVIFPIVKKGNVRLAFKYDIYATQPISRSEIYVDAHSGEILYKNPIIKHANDLTNSKTEKKIIENFSSFITGSAATRYSGSRSIETSLVGTNHVLKDFTRGNGIFTYNSARTTGYPSTNFIDANNDWTALEFANANKDNAALDAHWGAEKTFDFWLNTFNRNSFDNLGTPLKSYVHYRSVAGQSLSNAFWNGSVMSYGDGSTNPFTSLDVCGHEIGHAICQFTAGLAYQNQSGGINEGYSDIWGACIEQYGRTGSLSGPILPAVWKIGEDFSTGGLRSMSNPNSKGDPSTYLGDFWIPTGDEGSCDPATGPDNCGVHTNSGVLNKWFYILTVGESGTNNAPVPDNYNVTGIGMLKAAEIAYFTERDYLTANSTYADARVASLEVASNLYCPLSFEYVAVTNAWYAVNVGEQFVSYPKDVALKNVSKLINVSCVSLIYPTITFGNSGTDNITSVQISYNIDGGSTTNTSWTGNLAVCETQIFSIPIGSLSIGNHVLSVTISTLNDGNITNNTKSSIILVNNVGIPNSINPFENTTDNLISIEDGGNSNVMWQRGTLGTKTFLTAPSNVYATKLSGNYPDKTKSYLFSKCYDLTNVTNPKVEFDMAFDLEQDFDLLYVQTSVDGGITWNNLGTGIVNNWYNSNKTPNNVDCQNCVGGQWTGKDAVIKHYLYDLTQNSNVILRFVIQTDDAVNNDGIIIDNFQITGSVLSTNKNNFEVFAIYPNPSNGNISISLSTNADVKVSLNDISGRFIFNETFKNSDLTFQKEINFDKLSKGIYIINVESDGKIASKKMIIE